MSVCTAEMVADAKLQDAEVTARWHNIWFGCSVVFFATTALFAGLFGGYYSVWSNRAPCDNGEYWVFGNGTDFDDACHILGADGLYAVEGADCPSECDAWWHKQHPKHPTQRRRMHTTQQPSSKYPTAAEYKARENPDNTRSTPTQSARLLTSERAITDGRAHR